MRAGQLRKRVTIQSYSAPRDNFGAEEPKTWSTFATVWAAVELTFLADCLLTIQAIAVV